MTTVSKRNIEEIPDLVDVVVENKAGLFSFARYCPTGLQSVQITPWEYKNLLDILWAKYQQYKNTDTLFTLKDHLWTLFLYEKNCLQYLKISKKR